MGVVGGGSGVPDDAGGCSWSGGGALAETRLGFGFGFAGDRIEEGRVSCLSDEALDEALEVVQQLSRVWEVMRIDFVGVGLLPASMLVWGSESVLLLLSSS